MGDGLMISINASIQANSCLADGLWQLILAVDREFGPVTPGQFVHLRMIKKPGHILRRPFSVHQVLDWPGDRYGLVVTYQVVGEFTAQMSSLVTGDELGLLGPLGRGWQPPAACRSALLVGGGVGWAPLALLADSLAETGVKTDILIGVRNVDYLRVLTVQYDGIPVSMAPASQAASGFIHSIDSVDTGVNDSVGKGPVYFHVSTDDGSYGFNGMNTELLAGLLASHQFDYVAACGPEPMMQKVAASASAQGIVCEVSLERRMACGIGACLSCSVETRQGRRKVCSDGPVFDAREIIW
jgi:dihydroorotate dehydrogenase electron transfer subunit